MLTTPPIVGPLQRPVDPHALTDRQEDTRKATVFIVITDPRSPPTAISICSGSLASIPPYVRCFGAIRLTVTLDGPESRETSVALADAVDAHCPVLDNLRNPVPVTRTRADRPAAAA